MLRLHEVLGRSGSVQLQLAEGSLCQAVDLLGQTTDVPEGMDSRELAFGPYQVRSVLIRNPRQIKDCIR